VISRKGGVAFLDIDTGEVLIEIYCLDIDQLINAVSGTMKLIDKAVKSKSNPRGPEFYMGYQASQKAIYQDKEMSPIDKLVFSHALTVMGYGNRIKETQTEIAKKLNLSRSTVNRSFQRLKKIGAVYQNPRIKDRVVFNIHNHYAVKGKPVLINTEELKQQARKTKTGNPLIVFEGGKRSA